MAISAQTDEAVILEHRARTLARPPLQEQSLDATLEVLEFKLAGTRYAVELRLVEATLSIGGIVTIPRTPPHITGIIWRQGRSIALVNLRHFFHPQDRGIVDADFALIVNACFKRFALQVEEMNGTRRLRREDFTAVPETFDPAQQPFLLGITAEGLVLLDLERLVDADGFAVRNSNTAADEFDLGGK